jgi:hypothetical protein
MTFKETIAALAEKLGVEIDVEGDACALRAGAKDGTSVTIWMQGYDERGAVLMGADLGVPPPERLERLYRAMLEGNDLFRDTGGATLSINPDTGRVRLQRFDTFDALEEVGPDKAFAVFADVAAAWTQVIRDFRDAPEKDENAVDVCNLSRLRV